MGREISRCTSDSRVSSSDKNFHSYTSAALEPNFGMRLGITKISTTFQSPRPGAGAVAVALCHRCSVLTVDCHANLAHIAPELCHVNEISWVSPKSIPPSQ